MIYIRRELRLIQNSIHEALGFWTGIHRDPRLLYMEICLRIICVNDQKLERKCILAQSQGHGHSLMLLLWIVLRLCRKYAIICWCYLQRWRVWKHEYTNLKPLFILIAHWLWNFVSLNHVLVCYEVFVLAYLLIQTPLNSYSIGLLLYFKSLVTDSCNWSFIWSSIWLEKERVDIGITNCTKLSRKCTK